MSRYDTLESNIAGIIKANCPLIEKSAVLIRREMQHQARNVGKAPLVEIECESRNREMMCDLEDLVTADVRIRLSGKQRNSTADLNEAAESIILALKAHPNLNIPDDVGACNDWTAVSSTEQVDELRYLEITLTVRLCVPVAEV